MAVFIAGCIAPHDNRLRAGCACMWCFVFKISALTDLMERSIVNQLCVKQQSPPLLLQALILTAQPLFEHPMAVSGLFLSRLVGAQGGSCAATAGAPSALK